MFILYDLTFFIFSIFSLPSLFLRKRLNKSLLARFYVPRYLTEALKDKRPIWIHAVSMGEVMALRNFIKQLQDYNIPIILSTVTNTGNKVAKSILDERFVFYLPLDFSFIVSRFLSLINPFVFIVVETEIWPNLTSQLAKRHIPIVVINGRISDNAFKRYKFARIFLKNILNRISIFSMQSQSYAQRIISLGAKKEKVFVTGNMKFDTADSADFKTDYASLKQALNRNNEILLAAGSTHQGEEEILLGVYKRLLINFPNIRLLLAPRHVERIQEIERIVERFGFKNLRLSQYKEEEIKNGIFLLDTIGRLTDIYSIASVVFVGGSLVRIGGHNIIEPAVFGKPIIFGPFMNNFSDMSELFLSNGAAIMIKNGIELEMAITELLKDGEKKDALGKKALQLISLNKGATKNNLDIIKKFIPK